MTDQTKPGDEFQSPTLENSPELPHKEEGLRPEVEEQIEQTGIDNTAEKAEEAAAVPDERTKTDYKR